MSFLYQRKGSPFHWISYRHPITGVRVYESTGLKVSNRNETRQAHARALELTTKELALGRIVKTEAWSYWVEPFLNGKYSTAAQLRTLERYKTSWRNIVPFLEERGLRFPRQLQREDLFAYIEWRKTTRNERVRPCSFNTARHEIKLLGTILAEAVARGYCTRNVARDLGLKREPAAQKPEFTTEDILEIRRRLKAEPEWMQISYEIALHQGTRLRATQVDLHKDVDWAAGTITFHEKGNRKLTVPIAPELRPLLERRYREGHRFSCLIPRSASAAWRSFFDRMGRRDFCFHCCRVTTISRLARAGVSEALATRYVGHSSTEIHRSYQRLGVLDLVACHVTVAGTVGLDPSNAWTHTFRSPTESLL